MRLIDSHCHLESDRFRGDVDLVVGAARLTGVERILVQGLIQIAAGLHHLQQRRPRPAAGLLHKGLDKISRGASARCVDLHVEELAREVARLLAELDAPGVRVTNPKLPQL